MIRIPIVLVLALATAAAAPGDKPQFVKWEQAFPIAQAGGRAVAVVALMGADGKGC
jgi:hypothetical protein